MFPVVVENGCEVAERVGVDVLRDPAEDGLVERPKLLFVLL